MMKAISNPQVFLDVEIGGRSIGRMVFELFADVVPKTVENFRCLCTGEHGASVSSGKTLHYKKSLVHRIIPGFMAQGGDFTDHNGTGGESIYGARFPDENFSRKHEAAGMLSMANSGTLRCILCDVLLQLIFVNLSFPLPSGPGTNGSQFFITFRDTPHLDGRHVVFGKILSGQDVLKVLELVAVDSSDRPRAPVVIADCGQVGVEECNEQRTAVESISSDVISGSRSEINNPTNQSSEGNEVVVAAAIESEEEEEQDIEAQTAGMNDMEKRLFLLRMRMNKGRKENKSAVDEEYKKMTDPNYEKKMRAKEWASKKKQGATESKSKEDAFLSETAEVAGNKMDKKYQKMKAASTFGWEAFTQEANYRAYKKRLDNLPTNSKAEHADSFDPMQYGKVGTDISSEGVRRVVSDIEDREKKREKYSRRRNDFDTNVGAINDKNEVFNKKIKRSFDKYTVEIRQNLERGTAL